MHCTLINSNERASDVPSVAGAAMPLPSAQHTLLPTLARTFHERLVLFFLEEKRKELQYLSLKVCGHEAESKINEDSGSMSLSRRAILVKYILQSMFWALIEQKT